MVGLGTVLNIIGIAGGGAAGATGTLGIGIGMAPPGSMPPCGICHSSPGSTISGPSSRKRRPMV